MKQKEFYVSDWATITNVTKPTKTTYLDNELTLLNYKEPLTPISKGFGYYGTLTSTIDGGFIQCHICGNLFMNLGAHIRCRHKIGGREYKEKYGLNYGTALISESERARLKHITLEYLKTLTLEQKEDLKRRRIEKLKDMVRRRKQPKEQLESKNKKGTCPQQLLQKIIDVKDTLGKTPSKAEFIEHFKSQRYVHLIYKTFGSWKEALHILDMEPKKHSKGKHNSHYEKEELLEYLRSYAENNKAIPTYTDFKRGLLPSYDTYIRHFGSIENARKLADVYSYI